MTVREYEEQTESDDKSDSNFDSIFGSDSRDEVDDVVVRSVAAKRAKAKSSATISRKKGKPNGVMVKKLVSTGKEKRKREEVQFSKRLGPISKTT